MKNFVVDEQGSPIVHRIFHLESPVELQTLAKMLNVSQLPNIPPTGQSAHLAAPLYSRYPEALCLVSKMFAEDFSMFGYDPMYFENLRVNSSICQLDHSNKS